ncbi:hypothetical protein HHI36_014504 [Cryptolaemus montrouzieri]|uniref:Endonuclease/exonuclease/phosphatase domain-containing protein n=1 Tax=Cryptolaemus montrouzieri TaxID=559131 RepID=A0ABD2N2Y7_9CUCU
MILDRQLLILGDFNASSFVENLCDTRCISLEILAETLALKQFNHVKNDNNKILDLIFSNNECRILDDFAPLVKKDYHHPPINFIFDMRVQSIPDLGVNHAIRKKFNLGKANFIVMYDMILNADWSTVMEVADDPDEVY